MRLYIKKLELLLLLYDTRRVYYIVSSGKNVQDEWHIKINKKDYARQRPSKDQIGNQKSGKGEQEDI